MKKEYIILAIVTIALGGYLYFQNSDSTHYTLPEQAVIKSSDISKIEIVKKETTVSLFRLNDEWVVGEHKFPAAKTKVTPILEMLEELKLTALISESGNYARYQLDDKNKISVTAWKNDTIIRKIDVGKTASSYRHTFVKLNGNKNVYHASKNLKSIVDTNEEKLTDKNVLSFKSEGAYSVSVTDTDKTYTFTKKMDEEQVDITKKETPEANKEEPKEFWVSSTGDTKDKNSIEAFIKAFSNVECTNFISDLKKESLEKPLYSVTVTTVNKPNTLSVFKAEKDKDLVCTSSESDFVFGLSADKLEKFKKLFKEI